MTLLSVERLHVRNCPVYTVALHGSETQQHSKQFRQVQALTQLCADCLQMPKVESALQLQSKLQQRGLVHLCHQSIYYRT